MPRAPLVHMTGARTTACAEESDFNAKINETIMQLTPPAFAFLAWSVERASAGAYVFAYREHETQRTSPEAVALQCLLGSVLCLLCALLGGFRVRAHAFLGA